MAEEVHAIFAVCQPLKGDRPEAHIFAKTYAKASLKPALTVSFCTCEGRKTRCLENCS